MRPEDMTQEQIEDAIRFWQENDKWRRAQDAAGFTEEQAIIAQSVDPACWNAEECEIMNPSPRRSTDNGPAIIV